MYAVLLLCHATPYSYYTYTQTSRCARVGADRPPRAEVRGAAGAGLGLSILHYMYVCIYIYIY